jgi:hypothetical protein
MKKNIQLIIAIVFISQTAFSQSVVLSPTVIASAGNYSEAGNVSLSWTLGELAVTTLDQGSMILTQGFQQSFPKGTGLSLDPILWQIIAYPNPVNDELNLQFDLLEPTDFVIEFQDVSGRLLSQEQYKGVFPGDVLPLGMSKYKPGIYFLRISTTNREQVRVMSIRKL